MENLFSLTAGDLPPSAVFLDFLAGFCGGEGFTQQSWHQQQSEQLGRSGHAARERAAGSLAQLLQNEASRSAIARAYQWLRELASSNLEALRQLHDRYRFFAVIGVPRSGGSYIAAELLTALGYEPASVPAALAHDGFPEAGPTVFMPNHNGWMRTLMSTAEYLTMAELFFSRARGKHICVPKKLTKAIYASGFFKPILGRNAQLIVTVRHPLTCCISTYEKSGGLPPDGRFAERSAIEHWVKRDLMARGMSREALLRSDYFAVYLQYWEQYHSALALSGLMQSAPTQLVCFGAQRMQELASHWHRHFASERAVAHFQTRPGLQERHPQWMRDSSAAINRVADLWRRTGTVFPTAELHECL
jgi:hypothetical protein